MRVRWISLATLTAAILGALPAKSELTPLACSQQPPLRATAGATAETILVYRLDAGGRRALDSDISPRRGH